VDIRRFGPGHRRPDGPPGTIGISAQVIWNDARAHISELAFSRRALIGPHTNPNTALFVVISGGGFVQVGDERARVNHGEAVVMPPDTVRGAWTDGSEMRVLVVELMEGPYAPMIEGVAIPVEVTSTASVSRPPVSPGRGSLAERPARREDHDESEGEPW
jgi:quercetin dioxygenase-like cupin family protein